MHSWLKEIRISRNLTQKELANLTGISRTMVSEIENGNAKPSIESAKKIADVLDFNWIKFFDDSPMKQK